MKAGHIRVGGVGGFRGVLWRNRWCVANHLLELGDSATLLFQKVGHVTLFQLGWRDDAERLDAPVKCLRDICRIFLAGRVIVRQDGDVFPFKRKGVRFIPLVCIAGGRGDQTGTVTLGL